MMKIGVVADTHSKELPQQMLDDFLKVDFIIHAGDFCEAEDYKKLAQIKEVKGVYGNMDNHEITRRFPRRQILHCESIRVGVFHGTGPAKMIIKSVQDEFKCDHVDLVIFGHSHQPFNETIGETLFFNPGSPNDLVLAPYCSYGILEIADKNVKAKIIKVKN